MESRLIVSFGKVVNRKRRHPGGGSLERSWAYSLSWAGFHQGPWAGSVGQGNRAQWTSWLGKSNLGP